MIELGSPVYRLRGPAAPVGRGVQALIGEVTAVIGGVGEGPNHGSVIDAVARLGGGPSSRRCWPCRWKLGADHDYRRHRRQWRRC